MCLCKYASVFYLNSSISVTAPYSDKNGLDFILIVHFRLTISNIVTTCQLIIINFKLHVY